MEPKSLKKKQQTDKEGLLVSIKDSEDILINLKNKRTNSFIVQVVCTIRKL